jgi:putative membrane protein
MRENMTNSVLRKLVIIILIMTPVGIVIMLNTDLREKYLWTTTIFLSFQFVSLLLYLFLKYQYKSVVLVIPLLLMSGFALEYFGVKTSFPFGSYVYSETLQPQILNVPVAISLSWVVVVVSSFLIVSSLSSLNSFSLIVYSALLVLAFDIMLEPFASFINTFWIWNSASVPVQNYVSWFVVGIMFSMFLHKLLKKGTEYKDKSNFISYTPLIIYIINVIQFAIINLINNYFLTTFFGLFLISFIAIKIYWRRNEI